MPPKNHQLTASSTAANVTAPRTPLSELAARLSEIRNRVIDATSTARNNADAVLGEAPPRPETAPQYPRPVESGALGNAFDALIGVEEALDDLDIQVGRLNYIA